MEITHRQAQEPGIILDGGTLGIPVYNQVTKIQEIRGHEQLYRHLLIDIGGKKARHGMALMNRRIKALAEYVGRHGCHLSLHLGGLSTAPEAYRIGSGRMIVTIWIAKKETVIGEIVLDNYGHLNRWKNGTEHVGSHRCDAIWRTIVKLALPSRPA
jgi:hypothetical protein